MGSDLTKRGANPTAPEQADRTASRLKAALMRDALGRIIGESGEAQAVPGKPRVILVLANHGHSPGWKRTKVLQRQMFDAADGSGLEMKFACYGSDDPVGVRRCRITTRWIADPNDMASVMERAECNCGCYVYIRDALEQAVKENEERPVRAVIIIGDAFHDDPDGLDQAAISAIHLRRAGTRVFLIQQGDDPITVRRLQYLARVSGSAYFRFDPGTQERQFLEMWDAMSIYATHGEEALKAMCGPGATLLLQHLRQNPIPIMGERERIPVDRGITTERLESKDSIA
jgi:hypothetical protein